MKVFNTVLNIILLIAVIFLFTKVYGGPSAEKDSDPEKEISEKLKDQDFEGVKIAYINTDSLVERYDLHKELREKLEKKAKDLEADLAGKSRVFEENYAVLQQQAESMSPEELQAAQMDLQRTQQELMRYRDEKANELAAEEQELNTLIMADMQGVLDDIKDEYGLDYILSMDPNSILLSANKDYNITEAVVSRLNEKYRNGDAAPDASENNASE